MHLAAAALWGFCQSIANTPEGIAWGVLLAVTVLRLPKIHSAYQPALRDPAWILLLLWMIWMLASVTWAHPDVDRISSLRPTRWLITPLLLWPVMGYPWLLLGSIAAGGMVQALAATAMSIGPDQVLTYSRLRSLTGFGQFQVFMGSLLAISVGALSALRRPLLRLRLSLILVSMGAGFLLILSAGRASLGAAVASLVTLAIRPRRPGAALRLVACMVMVGLVVAISISSSVGNRVIARVMNEYRQIESLASTDATAALMRAGSHRGVLWFAAWNLGLQSPVIGHGRHSFEPLIREWAGTHASDRPEIEAGVTRVARVNHAHNTFLNIWVEGGAIGVVLFGLGLAILTERIWRQSANNASSATAAALLMIVLMGTLVGMSELKAGGALIAIALAISMRTCPNPYSP